MTAINQSSRIVAEKEEPFYFALSDYRFLLHFQEVQKLYYFPRPISQV